MTIQKSVTDQPVALDRKDAYRGLVAMMAELPAPYEIRFSDDEKFPAYLSVQLSTVEDFDEWVAALDTKAWKRNARYGKTLQSSAECVHWRGFDLYLGVCALAPVDVEAVA